MKTKIGILGSGMVGQTLANGFIKHGYEVMIATSDPAKYDALREATHGQAGIGNFEETARQADIVVLAVKGTAAEPAITKAGIANLEGKTIIDVTNPIAELPPVNGVLQFFTSSNESLMERLQKMAPEAHFVKAFNCVGNAQMVDPDFEGIKPTMFICGNHADAKKIVTAILSQFGWETEDMGAIEAARAIEPLCILWCIPGFTQNRWMHAFKLLKK